MVVIGIISLISVNTAAIRGGISLPQRMPTSTNHTSTPFFLPLKKCLAVQTIPFPLVVPTVALTNSPTGTAQRSSVWLRRKKEGRWLLAFAPCKWPYKFNSKTGNTHIRSNLVWGNAIELFSRVISSKWEISLTKFYRKFTSTFLPL